MRNLTLALIALATLAACSSTPAPAPTAYTCGKFKASVSSTGDTAIVSKPAGDIVLPKAKAEIGTRYADDAKGKKWPSLWIRDKKTTLWVNKKAYDCK